MGDMHFNFALSFCVAKKEVCTRYALQFTFGPK